MPTEKKARTIEHLQDVFSRSNISILADYRGLKTSELTALRRKLAEAGLEIEVVKNTLARIAAEKIGNTEAGKLFQGPVALITGFGEATEPAKILQSYIVENKLTMAVKGGFMKDKILAAADVVTLSKLPSREVLISQVVGGIQGPIYGLVNCLVGPMRGLLTVLQGRVKQLESQPVATGEAKVG
jgi:large subunit ribosomal protein L10